MVMIVRLASLISAELKEIVFKNPAHDIQSRNDGIRETVSKSV